MKERSNIENQLFFGRQAINHDGKSKSKSVKLPKKYCDDAAKIRKLQADADEMRAANADEVWD